MEIFESEIEFLKWIERVLQKLSSEKAHLYACEVWNDALTVAELNAVHFGHPFAPDPLAPLRAYRPFGDSPQGERVRNHLRDRLIEIEQNLTDQLRMPNGEGRAGDSQPKSAVGVVGGGEGRSDGPVKGHRWRVDGETVHETMQPAAWRMVSHLWKTPDKSASFDDLLVPVYDDQDHIADTVAFGSLRKAANNYFYSHGVPLKVAIKKTCVSLVDAKGE